MPRLPDEVVVHWGVDGPDQYGPPSVYVWFIVGVGLVVTAATGLFAVVPSHAPFVAMRKAIAVAALGVTVVVTGSLLVVLVTQAETSPLPGALGWLVPLAALVAVLVALVLLPPTEPRELRVIASEPVVIGATERVSWVGEAMVSRALLATFVVAVTAVTATGIVLTVLAVPGGWVALVVAVVLALSIASTASFTVTIDDRGLRVRSMIAVPRFTIPLAEIADARAITVTPLGDFGGWGLRVNGSRWGVVLRSGEALEVVKRDGRGLVVTVPRAVSAAAVLQGLLDARR
jgi:hypothetical protein